MVEPTVSTEFDPPFITIDPPARFSARVSSSRLPAFVVKSIHSAAPPVSEMPVAPTCPPTPLTVTVAAPPGIWKIAVSALFVHLTFVAPPLVVQFDVVLRSHVPVPLVMPAAVLMSHVNDDANADVETASVAAPIRTVIR